MILNLSATTPLRLLRPSPLTLAALAPISWGTTYIVTAHLPHHGPLTLALLRSLLAGLVLLAITRQLPSGTWWWKSLVLGLLNFALFFAALFLSAQRLPGGVASTLGAVGPLFVLAFTSWWLHTAPARPALGRALLGLIGVGLLVLGLGAHLNAIGVIIGVLGTIASAAGIVLSKKWAHPEGSSLLAVTAWQLTAGGLLLLPLVLLTEGLPPTTGGGECLLIAYLVLVGTALAYALWFRGVQSAEPVQTALLSRLSPATAIAIDLLSGRTLGAAQWVGLALIALSFLPYRRLGRTEP
jgi:probable blue pigment (indigoidine) exporter